MLCSSSRPTRVDALRDLGQKVDHARLARGIVIGGDVALGFVDGEIDMPLHLDFLAVDGDLAGTGVDLACRARERPGRRL